MCLKGRDASGTVVCQFMHHESLRAVKTHCSLRAFKNFVNSPAILGLNVHRLCDGRLVIPQDGYRKSDEAKGQGREFERCNRIALRNPAQFLNGKPQGLDYGDDAA